MKKSCFLFLILIILSLSASAQIAGITDFYGKYKFSATVEFTAAGDAYKNVLVAESDVEIRSGENCIAEIIGFAGSSKSHKISSIDIYANILTVSNPNNPSLWDDLNLANINGDNPFGVYDTNLGGWTVEFYGSLAYRYDPGTRIISVPDFSVVKVSDYKAEKALVIAKYTNVTIIPVDDSEENAFRWDGVYSLSSKVTSYSGEEYPSSFDVNIVYDTESGHYLVTKFMDNDISGLNYGGILLAPKGDGKSAALVAGGNLHMIVAGSSYIRMMDMNAGTSDINMVVNDNGTISVDNFSLVLSGSDGNRTLALYENVVLRRALPDGVKSFRLREVVSGKYMHINSYNADNTAGPTGSVIMTGKKESDDQVFVVEEAAGGACYLLSLSGYYIVCRPWNVDACNDGKKTALVFNYINDTEFNITNANGYFKVENVGGVVYPFCDAKATAAATWVLEEVVKDTGIENVDSDDVVVDGVYDLTGRRVNAIVSPGIYIIGGKKMLVK